MKAKLSSLLTWLLVLIVAGTALAILSPPAVEANAYEATLTPTPVHAYLPVVKSNYPRPIPVPPPPGTWHRYRMTYNITLTHYEGQTKVWMPVPTYWNTQKDIELLSYNPEPSDDFIESQGNRIVFWERTLESGVSSLFSEQFEVSSLEAQWQIDEGSVGSYDPSDPALATYLGSTEFIQTEHQEIQDAASDVVGNESNPYVKTRLLFDFVVDHMNGYGSENDALGAYRAQQGACGGYSHLFIALCRAAGVPARPVTGIAGLREGEHHWADGELSTHLWAEFYLPNYGWVPADPIGTDLEGVDTLGVSYGDRLVLSKGSDIELDHGITWGIPWFHMPFVNEHQEESADLTLIVEILDD